MRLAARDAVRPAGAQLGAMLDGPGRYRAYWLVNLAREPFGPVFAHPRHVARFIDMLRGDRP